MKYVMACVLLVVLFLLFWGVKIPPDVITSDEISGIYAIIKQDGESYQLTSEEIHYWKKLQFYNADSFVLGNTAEYTFKLIGDDLDYSAFFYENGAEVYFSFLPTIRYGVLNAPPPGGWQKPIYYTPLTKELSKLFNLE